MQGAASGAPDIPDDHVMPVGLPNMYTQVKVINRLSGQPVKGPDEQGEICVKSPQNFVGYLNATPEMQQKVMQYECQLIIQKKCFKCN